MGTAHVTVDPGRRVGPINRRLFGAFVEHLGRSVYDGIHEPGHPTATAAGFRGDVLDLVRELGVTAIRYPGGNFVSGYRWEDGVGPVSERPRRLDLAWHSLETNEIGLHEFAEWAELAGSEVMLALNLGTRGVQEALDLLEYATIRSGTALTDQRVANGRAEPFDITMWCLGNEMDGPWQLGHRSARDYGMLAAMTAKAMRQVNPNLELVVCGSSGAEMPTFGQWEREVLEHTYDDVDYISCHAYYQEKDGDLASFLASGVGMDRFITDVAATIDHVKAVKRSDHTVSISFDEWNVWYMDRFENEDKITDPQTWPRAPRLLEDRYSVADAVVVGGLLISLLRHADRVTSASLAQLVNVIAPIMTEPGGPAWRQTTFFPFAITSRLARGVALELEITSDTVSTTKYGVVDLVDAASTSDENGSALFLVNRDLANAATVSIDVSRLAATSILECVSLWDEDVTAANTLADPERVGMRANTSAVLANGILTLELPPVSWTAVALS